MTHLYCVHEIGDWWTVSGVVTDLNYPEEQDWVEFGGDFAGLFPSVQVRVDGVFVAFGEFPDMPRGGTGLVRVVNPSGHSQWFECWIPYN